MPDVIHKPPKHLGKDGRALWRQTCSAFVMEPHHLSLLELACMSADRLHEAAELIRRDGVTYVDPKGAIRPNPAVVIERDSRLAMVRCLRELNLDGAKVETGARPPMIAGGARYGRGA